MWKADRRLYLDRAGKVVEADDPTKHKLLVNKDQSLPLAQARELGLTDDQDAPTPSAREQRAKELQPAVNESAGEAEPAEPAATTDEKPKGAKKAAA
jgi:hypothetical protein